MKTVRRLTYLGSMVNAGGGCEVAVTARTRCQWLKSRECGMLLYWKRIPLMQKWVVYKRDVWTAVLYWSGA